MHFRERRYSATNIRCLQDNFKRRGVSNSLNNKHTRCFERYLIYLLILQYNLFSRTIDDIQQDIHEAPSWAVLFYFMKDKYLQIHANKYARRIISEVTDLSLLYVWRGKKSKGGDGVLDFSIGPRYFCSPFSRSHRGMIACARTIHSADEFHRSFQSTVAMDHFFLFRRSLHSSPVRNIMLVFAKRPAASVR